MEAPIDRQPVMVHCRPCRFAWVVLYTGMSLSRTGEILKRATCPRCGERQHVYMGDVPPDLAESPGPDA